MNKNVNHRSPHCLRKSAIVTFMAIGVSLFRMTAQTVVEEKVLYEIYLYAMSIQTDHNSLSSNNISVGWHLLNGNYTKQVEAGCRNYASINQVRGSSNWVKVIQQGNDNRVGYDRLYGDCLNLRKWGIMQVGSMNYGEINQWGDSQRAALFQYGMNNEAVIEQQGHLAGAIPDGNFANSSAIRQSGCGNIATIIQMYW